MNLADNPAKGALRPRLAEVGDFGAWFNRLDGVWHLTREASDGSHFSGTASFSRLGEAKYLLHETGTMKLAGGENLPATRDWIWFLTDRGEIEIRYPDEAGGKLYHRFRPERVDGVQGDAWRGMADHHCGADLYRGTYCLSAGSIEIVHHVTGPAKDYRLAARLERP